MNKMFLWAQLCKNKKTTKVVIQNAMSETHTLAKNNPSNDNRNNQMSQKEKNVSKLPYKLRLLHSFLTENCSNQKTNISNLL